MRSILRLVTQQGHFRKRIVETAAISPIGGHLRSQGTRGAALSLQIKEPSVRHPGNSIRHPIQYAAFGGELSVLVPDAVALTHVWKTFMHANHRAGGPDTPARCRAFSGVRCSVYYRRGQPDDFFLDGILHQLRLIVNIEFPHQVEFVSLHGFDA